MESTTEQPLYRVEMLGGLRIRQRDRLITRFPTYKTGALLAYLVYFRHRDTSREMLIEMFWPDYSGERARNNLSAALSALRTCLEPPGTPAGTTLLADRYNIRFNSERVTSDVHEFLTALSGSADSGENAEHAGRLSNAVALYAGELLPGYYEDWIVAERERLAEGHLQALRNLVRHYVKRKELTTALEFAQRAVTADLSREEAHRDLIRLFIATGQLSAALQQYHEMAEALAKSVGETPSAASRQLLQDIEARLKVEPEAKPTAPHSVPTATAVATLPTGLVTFMLAELVAEELTEKTAAPQASAVSPWQTWLKAQCGPHGGTFYRETPTGSMLIFAFATRALEFALACLQEFQGSTATPGPGPDTPRSSAALSILLHTAERVPDIPEEDAVAKQMARWLQTARAGQVFCSEATAILLRHDLPAGIRLSEEGFLPPNDLSPAERLFLIESPQSARPYPGPSLATPLAQRALPTPLTRFFGRQAEIARILRQLHEPQTRLITILGMGGSGKTRLAQEIAFSMAAELSGSVWFLPLADLTDAAHLPRSLADTLRLPPSAQDNTLEQVIAALEGQAALIVLDNFEQLVEAGASLVGTLLARLPELKLLVTSRQVLGLTGEQEFPLAPMAIPGTEVAPNRMAEFESVQLFLDRAQAARPDFRLTESNAPAIAALCNRLEGLPLAIELAAARSAVLAPEQMLKQLADRFSLLVSRKRDMAERHRTLRATLEWSYALLEPDLRDFLAHLSVFRGGWTVEAAEAVCEDPLALDRLAQLRECSLVQTEESDTHIRFRMLDTVREFASLHLDAGGRAERQRLHLDYFLGFARATTVTGGLAEQQTAEIEEELENLRAALIHSDASPATPEITLQLANALYPFWKLRGFYREGGQWLRRAANESLPLTLQTRAEALLGAGGLALLQGHYTTAADFLEHCLTLQRERGDARGEAAALMSLGGVAVHQNNLKKAGDCFEACLALRRAQQDWIGMADSLVWLGHLANRRGDLSEAQRFLGESLVLYQSHGTPGRTAVVLNHLGVLAHEQGQMELALAFYQQCLELCLQTGNKAEIARTQNNRGNVLREMGRGEEAERALQESLALWREMENPEEIALTLNTLGLAHCTCGDYPSAKRCFLETWVFYKEQGNREGLSYTLTGLAEIAIGEAKPEQAVRLLAQAERERIAQNRVLPRSDQRDWNRVMTLAQTALPAADFEAAWRIGAATPLALAASPEEPA